MKIGELAQVTGTKAETIRYYEKSGLLPRAERSSANYREYSREDAQRLVFIRLSRALGFDMAEVRSLLNLNEQPPATDKTVVSDLLRVVAEKIALLRRLQGALQRRSGPTEVGEADSEAPEFLSALAAFPPGEAVGDVAPASRTKKGNKGNKKD